MKKILGILSMCLALAASTAHGQATPPDTILGTSTNAGDVVIRTGPYPGNSNTEIRLKSTGVASFGGDLALHGNLFGPPLPAPAGLSATGSTSSGTLPAGTYCYEITSTDFSTVDSLLSNESCATIVSPGHVTLTWTTYSLGDGFAIYRGSSSAHENSVNYDISGSPFNLLTSFSDDGSHTFNSSGVPAYPGAASWNATASSITSLGEVFANSLFLNGAAGQDTLTITATATGQKAINATGDVSLSGALTIGSAIVSSGSAAPTGACAGRLLYLRTGQAASTTIYVCNSDTWTAVTVP